MHYVVYLDEFGHVGPFVSRFHEHHKTSPVFGFGGFLLPVNAVRDFAIYFYRLKCQLLKIEIDSQGLPPYRWEKKGAQLYTIRNIQTYQALRTATNRMLNKIRQMNGWVIHAGVHKATEPSAHLPTQTFKQQLLRSMKLADQHCAAQHATFMLLLDEQRGGSVWREHHVEACTLAMFSDTPKQCRTLIEPPIQGESHLFQTLQCADWLCGLIGRLCAYQVEPEQYADWEIFHRYFHQRLRNATICGSGIESAQSELR